MAHARLILVRLFLFGHEEAKRRNVRCSPPSQSEPSWPPGTRLAVLEVEQREGTTWQAHGYKVRVSLLRGSHCTPAHPSRAAALNHIFDDPSGPSVPSSPAKAPLEPAAAGPPPPPARKAAVIHLVDSESDDYAPRVPLYKGRAARKKSHKLRADVIDLGESSDAEEAPLAGPAPQAMFVLDETPPAGPAPRATFLEGAPDSEASPEDLALASVLAIIPDVLPSHVLALLRDSLYNGKVDLVLDHLLTKEKYPKVEVERKGRGKKRARSEEAAVEKERDYLEVNGRARLGTTYEEAACVLCPPLRTRKD